MKFFSENAELTGREKLSKQTSSSSGIVRSQSVRNTTELSDGKLGKQEPFARLNLNRTEDSKDLNFLETYAAGSKGKVRSVKENVQLQRQSKDCNPYATLPRASSVISTAEGTTRRTSIHDFLSKDTRQPIFVDPTPATAEQSIISSSRSDKKRLISHVPATFRCTPASLLAVSSPPPQNASFHGFFTHFGMFHAECLDAQALQVCVLRRYVIRVTLKLRVSFSPYLT
ncbi:Girdin [Ophiophagus hannah]|uniref:Girdin n=1 Tax=Ophiophagus hannah TaxID=8665 RepID=V8PJC4_OPHHA|nr:Girdin [Ophiophagus hannah]